MIRVVQQTVFIFLLILFLAALPNIIVIDPTVKTVSFELERLPQIYGDFINEVSNLSLGTYTLGGQQREISKDIGDNFLTSLMIMLCGVNSGVVLSLLFGIFISRFTLTRVVNAVLNVVAAIPDFIIILTSIILAVKFYKITGIRIISLSPNAGPINSWFPMMLVSIAPGLYLFKLVAVKYHQISGEDYIRTAVAKGMSLHYINFKHVYKNIEPFIIADLTKVVSLAIGNLFIIEYLLNVSGITKFIFLSKEIQPIAIGLFSLLCISLLVYLSTRIILYFFKRGFMYE